MAILPPTGNVDTPELATRLLLALSWQT